MEQRKLPRRCFQFSGTHPPLLITSEGYQQERETTIVYICSMKKSNYRTFRPMLVERFASGATTARRVPVRAKSYKHAQDILKTWYPNCAIL